MCIRDRPPIARLGGIITPRLDVLRQILPCAGCLHSRIYHERRGIASVPQHQRLRFCQKCIEVAEVVDFALQQDRNIFGVHAKVEVSLLYATTQFERPRNLDPVYKDVA